jgi:Xaa-Pro dipeptidase
MGWSRLFPTRDEEEGMKLVEELVKEPIPSRLAFPEREYEDRLRRVRKNMANADIEVLLISSTPSLGYLTGYDTTMSPGYTVAIVPLEGDITLHCSELEAPCALLESTMRDIEVFYWYEAKDTGTDLARVLQERGHGTRRIGLEAGNAETFASGAFDVRSYWRLKELLPDATFHDATEVVLEARIRKSPAELEYMRKAGEYTFAGLMASIDAVAEGRTENEVVAAGYQAMVSAGSELMSIDPMIMSGWRTGWMPHIAYKRERLQAGDPVYLEYSGSHRRYNAPSMRSAVVGEPSDGIRRLADASIATVGLLVENIRPGRTGHDVAQEAKKGLASVPEAFFHGGFAYSIGMGFQPSWTENPMYVADGIEREFEPGMTFHLPMCIWVPRQYGIGFSESVVVTETGCELLTPGGRRDLAVR